MKIVAAEREAQIQQNAFDIKRLKRLASDKTALEKVKYIAKIAFSILLSLVLFWVNPAIFFVSFVIGVAFNKVMQKAVDKIKTFVLHHKLITTVGCVLLGVLVMPVFVAAGSVIWSLHIGSQLSQHAQDALKK